MTIVITGANRGIGAGLMHAYRKRGENVVATARSGHGFVALDVSKPKEFSGLKSALADASVDLLVCNAGVYLDKGQSIETGFDAQEWADTFSVNVTGVFLTIQTLLDNLKLAKDAKIAIISSQMASHERAPGGSYIYRASKAAVLNLGRNLASDLAAHDIAVGIYHPGWVQTDMGGQTAAITTDEAVSGLVAEFDTLSMNTTGCFRTWDGRDHPY